MVRPGKEVKTLAVSQSPLARLDERVAVPLQRAEAAAEIYQPRQARGGRGKLNSRLRRFRLLFFSVSYSHLTLPTSDLV